MTKHNFSVTIACGKQTKAKVSCCHINMKNQAMQFKDTKFTIKDSEMEILIQEKINELVNNLLINE